MGIKISRLHQQHSSVPALLLLVQYRDGRLRVLLGTSERVHLNKWNEAKQISAVCSVSPDLGFLTPVLLCRCSQLWSSRQGFSISVYLRRGSCLRSFVAGDLITDLLEQLFLISFCRSWDLTSSLPGQGFLVPVFLRGLLEFLLVYRCRGSPQRSFRAGALVFSLL